MTDKDLKISVSEIKMSEETKRQVINNCYSRLYEKEKNTMKKRNFTLKKLVPVVIIAAICVISAGAFANHIRGFKDVTKGTAVIGTEFCEETEMIQISTQIEDNLKVSAHIVDYTSFPYSEISELEIGNYEIVNISGNIIEKGNAKSTTDFKDGNVAFEIPLDTIPEGKYTLVINGFVGHKKADQPLPITGKWEISFTK